ncbi:outer membrane beta-barrel protein [Microbulbifer rhizosphaerae]|uniref:Opacity protein-like surface antigen n=1 Tax=Microbulbifer rhizosphaerae TaxID=1562603 RepID=A0A7W4W9U1_9GAMM|nr:outer membrane beta-barrel protein [Microbulbifer rhizosphaerae]MBB3059842.1 opacity protein-like surface antigen [Microbulbifer rhizosphaerae]
MRTFAKGLAALALACSSAANAEGGYFGGTAGLMTIDRSNFDDPFNLGLRAGYTFASGWGFEGEYTNSIISGEADAFSGDIDVDIQTLAFYGTYRSHGNIYFKGRAGILHEDIDFFGDDTGISLGAGVGFNFGPNTNVELEYTLIEEDVNFWSGTMILSF